MRRQDLPEFVSALGRVGDDAPEFAHAQIVVDARSDDSNRRTWQMGSKYRKIPRIRPLRV